VTVTIMSKLPRKVSGQNVLKVLQQHGFTIRQGRGSHMGAWKRIGDRTIWLTIPLHREIKPGLLNAIITESGIPKSEFIQELEAL